MIFLARFHTGERIAINPDLIERIEETPDTVITLTNGSRYVVQESLAEIAEQVQLYRATILNLAMKMAQGPDTPDQAASARLSLVRDAVTGATSAD